MTDQEKMPETVAEWADLYTKAIDEQDVMPTEKQLSLKIYSAMVGKFGEAATNEAIDARLL